MKIFNSSSFDCSEYRHIDILYFISNNLFLQFFSQETKENLNFDELILDAAKAIANATSVLVKCASAAQRELIVSGKVSRTPLISSDDGQWSEGLVSAAKMVAAATHSLVESANALVQGFSSEEKLISSAKQVATSTAQLIVACKVKAEPDSESTRRLQAAGNAVKRATDNLVRAAQDAIQHEEERMLILNKKIVGGIAQEINARSEVLRVERELEEARGRLTAIRQAKYRNRYDYSDTDTDADQSGYDTYSSTSRFYDSCSHPQDQQQGSPFVSQIKNDREQLVSPEKVSYTQSTLERKKKEKERLAKASADSDNLETPDGFHSPVYQAPFSPKLHSRKIVDTQRNVRDQNYDYTVLDKDRFDYSDKFSGHSSVNTYYSDKESEHYEQQLMGNSCSQVSFNQTLNSSDNAPNNNLVSSTPLKNEKDTFETRTLKESITQTITEKKTVTETTSSHKEFNTNTFSFKDE